jgi:hypothetical protein
MPFSLEVVTLGIDARGNPVTSCVVRQQDGGLAPKKGKPGRKATATDGEYLGLLPRASTMEWLKAAIEELGVSRSTFYEVKKRLDKDSHLAVQEEHGGWRKADLKNEYTVAEPPK